MLSTRLALAGSVLLLVAACNTGGGATPSPAEAATVCDNLPADVAGDQLEAICNAGVIKVSTDPNYAPQSFLNPDGTFEGFDIDTANEIGRRLGVTVQFETPSFDAVVAGSWSGRWDISVGSVTITEDRQGILDFTEPYYYTPAQMAATEASGITTLEGLAGKTVCVAAATTYLDWLEGDLSLVGSPEPATPPEGLVPTTLETDQLCAQAVASGRTDFEGFLSSSTTIQAAIDADTPIVTVGDPVFYEALAVATDKSQADHDALMTALDGIIADMHEDGTLTGFSEDHFGGLDLTVAQ
jgi:polar amino acid transport system substrate-binding protein